MTFRGFLSQILIFVMISSCSSKDIAAGEGEVKVENPSEKIENTDSSSGNASGITPEDMILRMGRGINIGNVMSAPVEGNWSPAITEKYIADIANAGFSTVRIPMRFDMHTTALNEVNYTDPSGNYSGSPSDYKVNTSYLDRVEQVTDWALSYDLVAIIDIHGDHWFWESYKENSEYYKTGNDRKAAEDRFRAIWRDIAGRFQNKKDDLLFEIMNEAYFSMNAEEVNYINQEILKIIRETNPKRNVIVTGGGKNSFEAPLQLDKAFLKKDKNLIATFHYYKPFNFTSSSREGKDDFEWGTDADKAKIDQDFDEVYEWSKANDIPVLLGEFGADNEGGYDYHKMEYGDFGGPTKKSRVEYHKYLANAALTRGFAFTAWDAGFKSNKAIYLANTGEWVTDIKEALLE